MEPDEGGKKGRLQERQDNTDKKAGACAEHGRPQADWTAEASLLAAAEVDQCETRGRK